MKKAYPAIVRSVVFYAVYAVALAFVPVMVLIAASFVMQHDTAGTLALGCFVWEQHPYLLLLLSDCAALLVLIGLAGRRFPKAAGFSHLPLWKCLLCLLLGAGLNLLFGQVQRFFPQETVVSNEPLLVKAAAVCVFAPLAEEVTFRGMMHGALKDTLPPWWIACFTAVLFAFSHTGTSQMLLMFLFGLLLSLFREKTDSVLVPLLVHAGFNLISFLLFL